MADLCCGSVFIPLRHLWQADAVGSANHLLMHDFRLPKAISAVIAGCALSVSGLMMQTLFRNPLAGPYILGVSSGATLGVGFCVMLGSLLGFATTNMLTTVSAVLGATMILLVVLAVSYKIENNVSLLIIGMMFGSIASALVGVMQSFANPDSLKLFIVWSLGSLSAVGWQQMPTLVAIFISGMLLSVGLIKSLNGLILGENYARGLGINVNRTRFLIVLSTGLLAGGITAYCGPIAFVGVAVPHLARGVFRTSNNKVIMPATAIIGADLVLLCDILSNLFTYPLPISTTSALLAAPIIIYVIMKK